MSTTYFVDYVGGSDAAAGTSFATRKKTIQSATGLAVAGDAVRVMASLVPVSLGQNATWTNASPTVTLASSVTTLITDCETNWTASSNVTCTSNTTNFKENITSQQIAVAAGFTTGLAAFFATGTLNLSTKNQVSFWIRVSAGLAAAKNFSIRLCSDTIGAVSVATIAIPDLTGGILNQWIPITVDTGGALPSVVNSIALYVDTDNGAFTVLLDDIIACGPSGTTSSLSLTSLLGWSDSTGAGGANTETWYGICSINGTTVKLDNYSATANAGAGRGWSSRVVAINSSTNANPININATAHGLVTGDVITIAGHKVNTNANGTGLTVTRVDANNFTIAVAGNGVGTATGAFWATTIIRTTWRRETTKTALVAAAATDVQTVAVSGSSGSPITISGGWNTTDMSTQTDETWYDGQIGTGIGLDYLNTSWVTTTLLSFTRYSNAMNFGATSTNLTVSGTGLNNCNNAVAASTGANFHTFNFTAANNNGGNGFSAAFGSCSATFLSVSNNAGGLNATFGNATFIVQSICNNSGTACTIPSASTLTAVGVIGNTAVALNVNNQSQFSATLIANNGTAVQTTSSCFWKGTINTTGNTNCITITTGEGWLKSSYMAEGTIVGGYTAFARAKVLSLDDQGVAGSFTIYTDGGGVVTDTSTVHTAGTSWKFSITATTRNSSYPLRMATTPFTVVSGRTYTIAAWVRRDSVTTLNAGIRIAGGQVTGVPNTITANGVGSANTWEQVTLATFTPTESTAIELTFQAWDGTGTTNNAWFDDVTINDGISTFSLTLDYTSQKFGPGPESLVASAANQYVLGTSYGGPASGTATLPPDNVVLQHSDGGPTAYGVAGKSNTGSLPGGGSGGGVIIGS